jgi:hypothetical protein
MKKEVISKENLVIFKKIEKIFKKHFNKDLIYFYKELGSIYCPAGVLLLDGDTWVFSIDFDWIDNKEDSSEIIYFIYTYSNLLKNLFTIIPNLMFDLGHFSVFDENKNFVDTISNDEILEDIEKTGHFYSLSKHLLSQKLIVENEEKNK